jgi:hypothetical protein
MNCEDGHECQFMNKKNRTQITRQGEELQIYEYIYTKKDTRPFREGYLRMREYIRHYITFQRFVGRGGGWVVRIICMRLKHLSTGIIGYENELCIICIRFKHISYENNWM